MGKHKRRFSYFDYESELKALAEHSFNAIINVASVEEIADFLKLENEYQKRCLHFQKLIDRHNDKVMASKEDQ